jgi:DNA-directed RNA polymerase specialized sigma24 family protein
MTVVNLRTEEGTQFEALWDQYADLIYNLAIRLTCSTKQGWLLTRAAFLEARRTSKSLEGNTPSLWLYRITIDQWLTPYLEQRTFWSRYFRKKKFRWEACLPHTVEADLTYLSDEQELLLRLLKTLDYPQRLTAVLHLADGFTAQEIARLVPLKERQIRKAADSARLGLAQLIPSTDHSMPADPAGPSEKIASILHQWKPLKAPLTLKADIIYRRVTQRLMEYEHIPNRYSLKGMILVFLTALFLLVASWYYFWILGHRPITAIY